MATTEQQAPAAQGQLGLGSRRKGIDFHELASGIQDLTASVIGKIEIARKRDADKKDMSIAEMFDLQLAMNQLSQFSEMSTSLVSAMNGAISTMARNVKG